MTLPVCGSIPVDGAVAAVGDPHRAGANRDPRQGELPTGIVVVTARVSGSILTTALSSESATHTPLVADRDPARSVANRDRRQQPGRIDARDGVGPVVGDPNGAVAADRDRRRAGVRVELVDDSPGRCVDAGEQTVGRCRPDLIALRRDGFRATRDYVAEPYRWLERVELGIDRE